MGRISFLIFLYLIHFIFLFKFNIKFIIKKINIKIQKYAPKDRGVGQKKEKIRYYHIQNI